ncbi:ATP-binding cassette domain-containing protein [Streptomyces sp. NPDC051776]|uniref:ABC transporter permease subunit n=1 Tax=Streptomyces sp. NPDC051776 TaxID=3155414 RepID=UPI0034165BEA
MGSLTYELTLAGVAVGSAAALTGIGLIVTYRATGVLNLAQGAVAMVTAYVMWQFAVAWGWPLAAAAAVSLLIVAPGIGLLLDAVVFRPLSRSRDLSGAGPARTLVASLGVFVLLIGGATLVWGPGAQADAPALLPEDPWVQLGTAVVLAAGVGAVTRWTPFGRELRAVVDNRRLAVLGGVDADRVAAAGWAFGAFTAGLTGVLLAPYVRLDPYGLPLLVMEAMAVAVAAAMRSLPVAVLVALAIGVAQSQMTRLHPRGWAEPLVQAMGANLFVIALLIAALALPAVGAVRGLTAGTESALPLGRRRRGRHPGTAWLVCGVLFLLPLGLAGRDLYAAAEVPALAVVLLSLVVVTGMGGQISLGQAAYAGLGALFTALLAAGRFPGLPALPELLALGVAVVLVAPLGLLTGGPAIRRHGLALALVTLAVGVAVSRFVFVQPYATSGLTLGRPAGFDGDRAFYLLEVVVLAGALAAVAVLRRGRAGRALAAMRDHEPGAAAAGVQVPQLKIAAFAAGAALAALGGGLLGMGARAFDPGAFDPVRSLLWFAAVVVLGADSLLGAMLAAALLVGLDAGARGGVAAALIGLLAVLVGHFPDGVTGALRSAAARLFPLRGTPALTPLGVRVATRLAAAGAPTAAPAPSRAAAADSGRAVSPPGADNRGSDTGSAGRGAGDPGSGRGDPGSCTGGPGSGSPGPPGPGEPGSGPGDPGSGPGDPGSGPGDPGSGPGDPGSGPDSPGSGPDSPGSDPAGPGSDPAGPGSDPAGPGSDPGPEPPWRPRLPRRPAARRSESGDRSAGDGTRSGTRGGTRGDETRGDETRGARSRGPGTGGPATAGHGTGARPVPGLHGQAPRPRGRLTARGIRVTYGGFAVLDGVDIAVSPGTVTALIGPNGAGKSTLFHCLAGTLRPRSGRVVLDGRDITRRPAHARTRLGIARTFQQLAVFPSLTVAENVRIGAEQGRVRDPAAVGRILRLLGLDGPVRDAPAAGLSTGTLRRVELARALAGGPTTLLLDEPAAGLDATEVAALARALRALAADGMALLIVEHDLDLVGGLADTVYAMAAGRIVATGPAGRVLAETAP